MNLTKTIPYENLNLLNAKYSAAFKDAFSNILAEGFFVLGENVTKFEEEFARFLGVPYVVGVASGLDALILPLLALDLPEGSEIIVPSNTYIATINAILLAGHKPIFVEPDIATYNIDPKRIEEKISSKTKAIMIVHLYGKSCEMTPIMELCQKYELELIEDCAQSHGTSYEGKMTGSFGIGAFSFYPTKNLGALGEGGAIACKDEALYQKFLMLRNYGQKKKYVNEIIGFNSRLDEIQAAFLRIKLRDLTNINNHKKKLACIYTKHLSEQYTLPTISKNEENVYHIYPVRHPERDRLREYLINNGVHNTIHYPIAPCDQNAIKNIFKKKNFHLEENDFKLARLISATELSLPCSYIHSEADILQVIEVMNNF